MPFRILIEHVQHVKRLSLELDLTQNKLTCIVGKNGVGKTTLIRAVRNLSKADTFLRTAAPDIFRAESCISYRIDGVDIRFDYDSNIRTLNCKTPIPEEIRQLCVTELPMPHGERFHSFPLISGADADIRRQIILEEYTQPVELIKFLTDIYSSGKFESLIETEVGGRNYYCILQNDGRYVREDYFSSGEYLLVNLYRTFKGGARLIAIDEIDLSLDAAAQVHLLQWLRGFCAQYGCNVLFTTHSLAMMRKLEPSELLYMEQRETGVELIPASYSYINTLLFGFTGWDRYILTEDVVLHAFLEAVIQRYCPNAFYQYKIIHVGGASHAADLLRRNEVEGFLSEAGNVIAVLDGDAQGQPFATHPKIYFLPIANVEAALFQYYDEADFPYRYPGDRQFTNAKDLFHALQKAGVMSRAQIHSYLLERNNQAMAPLVEVIGRFLSRPP